MSSRPLRLSRRSTTLVAVMIGTVSLAIGAHAALYKRGSEVTKAAEVVDTQISAKGSSRIALVVGNGHYPDADAPLIQPINDARALAATLRHDGFDVDMIEDARKTDLRQAVERLTAKVRPDSVVMLFFAGYGVQGGPESYMIPVDAAIWREADVRRDGTSVQSVLAAIKQRGAKARLVVVDASRRNPYERRFRAYSHGLAPIEAPDNALILSSAMSGKVADDADGQNSLLVSALIGNLASQDGVEAIFNKTRTDVAQASNGAQVPSLSSSLLTDVPFRPEADTSVAKAGS